MTVEAEHDALEDMAALVEEVRQAPLELRSAPVVDVRHPDRVVEVVVSPYDTEVPVVRGGRWVVESFARSAWEGIEKRPNRIKVNRDHDPRLAVGRAVSMHPSRAEGLVGVLRISKTPLGEETLELAADGVLGASVGFRPMPGGETWTENRARRRVERAYLGHIALVSDPAYETAEVLDVRSSSAALQQFAQALALGEPAAIAAAAATPNKDAVLARLAELGYPRRSS